MIGFELNLAARDERPSRLKSAQLLKLDLDIDLNGRVDCLLASAAMTLDVCVELTDKKLEAVAAAMSEARDAAAS
ncbi:hypothetical protein QSU92_02390 [Microbacterium sp. ET2]|uniref:hypothetical protein n=1 Tax=Microbacterium albipurpureum TaxID=3050384 RepID=UPI00259D11CE|nr:hypothetical protein [Microbacterium sp. ET2 (Ac-2212)]WJL96080.1 hypothetical protein QSU92_02390 [Microbacterium sp. ET2 (Ac-2212)]